MVESTPRGGTLADVVEMLLNKGVVINADIAVSVAGVELLGIKIRAALASFETAAKYGLMFPIGTDLTKKAFQDAEKNKVKCPGCGNEREENELIENGCPICAWESPRKRKIVVEA